MISAITPTAPTGEVRKALCLRVSKVTFTLVNHLYCWNEEFCDCCHEGDTVQCLRSGRMTCLGMNMSSWLQTDHCVACAPCLNWTVELHTVMEIAVNILMELAKLPKTTGVDIFLNLPWFGWTESTTLCRSSRFWMTVDLTNADIVWLVFLKIYQIQHGYFISAS